MLPSMLIRNEPAMHVWIFHFRSRLFLGKKVGATANSSGEKRSRITEVCLPFLSLNYNQSDLTIKSEMHEYDHLV